jgi:EpsI family protein
MLTRTWTAALVLALAAAYVHVSARHEISMRADLDTIPLRLGGWTGTPAGELSEETLRVLGADAYIERIYTSEGAAAPVALFVGFYGRQRQGDAIHSPLNCLPGSGWTTLERARVRVPADPAPIDVNRLLVGKGFDRYEVLYWYESRGRAVASEYTNKLLLVADAIRFNRSDGAIVRVMTPVGKSPEAAQRTATAFVRAAYPALRRHLPGPPQ